MADSPIASCMAELGFKADLAAAKKTIDVQAQTEAAYTKAASEGAAKREAIESGATSKRIGLAGSLGKILGELEQQRADRAAKIKKDEAAQDERLTAERERKGKERRAAAVKDLQAHATRMATFALKLIGGVEAIALGIVAATNAAAKSMERLGYASQRAGSTPGKMTAAGYAFSQMGSTAEAGQASVRILGEKLKENPNGYASYLKHLGVEARKANGELRDTSDIAVDLGEALARVKKQGGAIGYSQAKGYGAGIGWDEDMVQTSMDPRYRRYEKEQADIDAKVGTDRDAGADTGSKFETSMRRLETTIGSLKTKVATDLAKNIQPTLDALSDWASAHGKEISDAVVSVADGILKLATAVIDRLSKVDWDKVIKDVSEFGKSLDAEMTKLFGDDGKMVLALAGFAALVGTKVLGPLNVVLSTLKLIGAVPLVGRLLGGAAASTAGVTATALVAGGVADAAMAKRTGDAMSGGDPNAKFDPETGFVNDLDFGYGDKGSGGTKSSGGGAWSWLKSKFGFGDADPDARKVKDAIVSTAEGVKKLADRMIGVGGGPGGGGAPLGSGAANLRYGRKGGGDSGSYRGTPIADVPYNGKNIEGLTEAQSKQYASILGNRESGNRYGITNPYGYAGRWQFGASALAENGYVRPGTTNAGLKDPGVWLGKNGASSLSDWLANKGNVQDTALGEYTNRHYAQLKAAGVIRSGMSPAEISGWLAAAHLKGVEGAIRLSQGHDNVDANGTSASSYRRMMAGVGSAKESPPAAAAPTSPATPASPVGPTGPAMTDAEAREAEAWIYSLGKDHPLTQAEIDKMGVLGKRLNEYHASKPLKTMDHKGPWAKTKGRLSPEISPEARKMKVDDEFPTAVTADEGKAPLGTAGKPIHVEVTDKSADKIGQGLGRRGLMKYAEGNKVIGKAARDLVEAHRRSVEVRNHLAATQASIRAHQGRVLGIDPRSSLGRHIRHSIDNSRRQISMTHAPVFNMQGGDPHAMLADAHRLAGRGQADLVRNMSVMTS